MPKYRDTTVTRVIGYNLRMLRQAKGISQKQLSLELDIMQQQLCKYEYGKNTPSASLLYRMAEVLACRLDDFFRTGVER